MNAHGVPFREIEGKRVVLFEDMSGKIKEMFDGYLASSPETAMHRNGKGVPHSLYAGWAQSVCP